jgi:hypothetical protein
MNIAIVSELRLTETSLVTRRNLQDLTCSTDASAATRIDNDDIVLAANNISQDNAASQVSLGVITAFVHITATQPINVTLTRNSQSVVVLVNRYLVITGDFSQIVLTNTNQTSPVQIKAVYA